MASGWIPDRERGYNLRCTHCGRPTAKKTGKTKAALFCKHCVQEILLGCRIVLYTDYETGETIKGSPNFGAISADGVRRKPRVRRGILRKPRTERGEVIRRPRVSPVKRRPRIRAAEVDEAFKEKAGLVKESLEELGG